MLNSLRVFFFVCLFLVNAVIFPPNIPLVILTTVFQFYLLISPQYFFFLHTSRIDVVLHRSDLDIYAMVVGMDSF